MKSRPTEPETMATKPPSCPKCGSDRVVPMVMGYPTEEAEVLAKRGEIALAGCIPRDPQPGWCCRQCGWEWRDRGHRARLELERLFTGVGQDEG